MSQEASDLVERLRAHAVGLAGIPALAKDISEAITALSSAERRAEEAEAKVARQATEIQRMARKIKNQRGMARMTWRIVEDRAHWTRGILNRNRYLDFCTAESEKRKAAESRATALQQEVDRCHARLEIDHYFKIGDNDDSDLERVEIPMEERADFPDAVTARDATIALLEEDRAALQQRCDKLVEALEPFAEAADCIDDNEGDRIEMWEHPASMQVTAGDFRRARNALGVGG